MAYSSAQLAEGRIRQATARLLAKFPFHAYVLEQFKMIASTSVGTMGVTATRGEVILLFNPDFVLRLPANQLGGVLLHEVLHVVLGHLTLDPANYPDHWALTVASEISVNEFVHEPLPPGAIRLEQFPQLPLLESTDERYRRLAKVKDRNGVETQNVLGEENPKGQTGVLDNHRVWVEPGEDKNIIREAIADVIEQAAIEAGGLPHELQQVLSDAVGSQTGADAQSLEGSGEDQLNWKTLLRRYCGQILEPQPRYNWPARRCPHLVGIVPGKRRSPTRPTVMAVIDTSGSISNTCLEDISAELARLNRSHSVQVVECDCKIHRVYRYRGRLKNVTGRGGTDFRPPLKRAFLRQVRPDVIVFFTDGDGPAPAKAPRCPLIWCLVRDGEPPAPWGRVVWMEKDA